MALLAACSGGKDDTGTVAAVSTAPPASSTSSSTASSTTTTPPRTTVTTRPTTTVTVPAPERVAKALYDAWAAGDRTAASKAAQPDAVAALFARPWQATDGWAFSECTGAAGSMICTWTRPAGQQVLFRVPNVTGGGAVLVAEVRFQP